MGGSCLPSCVAWGVQHWSLLSVGSSWVLALRCRSLGELSPIDIMWSREVCGAPMSWTQLSHLRGSGLTVGWSTTILSATRLSPDRFLESSSLKCSEVLIKEVGVAGCWGSLEKRRGKAACFHICFLSLSIRVSHFIIFEKISTHWPILHIVSYFNFSHSSGCDMVSDYSFSLLFSDD